MVSTLQELILALQDLRLAVTIDTASCAIYAYDYLLTFEDECTLMWPKKWSPSKVLFLAVRYLPIVDIFLTAYSQFAPNLSPEKCSVLFKAAVWLMNFGIVTAELILLMRTYAIWGAKRNILVALTAWGIANLIPDIVIMSLFLKSIGFTAKPPGLPGCLVTSGNNFLIGVWIILMFYELVLVILLAIKGVQLYRENGWTPLNRALFQDGAIFYIYIFTLSSANVIVLATMSRDKSKYGMLAGLERVAHSVLTARLLLKLNKVTRVPKQDQGETLDDMDFAMGPEEPAEREADFRTNSSSDRSVQL